MLALKHEYIYVGASFSGSLTGSFTSRHSNSAIWPRRSLESRRAGPGAAEAANPVLAAALAREQHQQVCPFLLAAGIKSNCLSEIAHTIFP